MQIELKLSSKYAAEFQLYFVGLSPHLWSFSIYKIEPQKLSTEFDAQFELAPNYEN